MKRFAQHKLANAPVAAPGDPNIVDTRKRSFEIEPSSGQSFRKQTLMTLFCLLLTVPLLTPGCSSVPGADGGHDFVRWEKDMMAFEAMDRTNPPPRGALLFIGSSTIRMWKTLAQDYPGQPVINRGFGGSEIVDSTHFCERIVFPYEPRMILFRAGGNDLWNGKSPQQVFTDYHEFVTRVHATLPETEIVWISWSPTPSRWIQADKEKKLNQLVKNLSDNTPNLDYIEAYDLVLDSEGHPRAELFLEDELHLNTEGYRLLAERVRPFLPGDRPASGNPGL